MRLLVKNYMGIQGEQSFDLSAGGLLILTGRNGAGKTSMLTALRCLLTRDADPSRLGGAKHYGHNGLDFALKLTRQHAGAEEFVQFDGKQFRDSDPGHLRAPAAAFADWINAGLFSPKAKDRAEFVSSWLSPAKPTEQDWFKEYGKAVPHPPPSVDTRALAKQAAANPEHAEKDLAARQSSARKATERHLPHDLAFGVNVVSSWLNETGADIRSIADIEADSKSAERAVVKAQGKFVAPDPELPAKLEDARLELKQKKETVDFFKKELRKAEDAIDEHKKANPPKPKGKTMECPACHHLIEYKIENGMAVAVPPENDPVAAKLSQAFNSANNELRIRERERDTALADWERLDKAVKDAPSAAECYATHEERDQAITEAVSKADGYGKELSARAHWDAAKDAFACYMAYSALRDATKPDGLLAEFMAKSVGEINAAIADLQTEGLAAYSISEFDFKVERADNSQPISTASGGERWLAAASLQFAVAMSNNSPFVVFDEAGALDERAREEVVQIVKGKAEATGITALIAMPTTASRKDGFKHFDGGQA